MNTYKQEFELDVDKTLAFLDHELKNFQEIAERLKPSSGDSPILAGIDIYGAEIPYNGIVGGDHIIYVDFNKRYDLDHRIDEAREAGNQPVVEKLELNKRRAGILLADAAGHNITDALMVAMLHQSFLTGVQYELREHGEITSGLFEILNSRFFNSSSLKNFITLIYGEISDTGTFSFLNAGHPRPVVFSNQYDRLSKVCYERVINFPPIGTLPSKEDLDSQCNVSRLGHKKKYTTNEINLMGDGDILILFTDGLSEHNRDMQEFYFPDQLENILRRTKHQSARDIWHAIKTDLVAYADPMDDISFVIIKRTSV